MQARLLLMVCLAFLAGCNGGAAPTAAKRETSHLRAIVSLYNFANSNTGRPPANEQEFKQFIAENGTALMERLNIASPDELFVSERDSQPFVVVYGKRPPGMSPDVVAYEQTGVDGKREVGFKLGMVQEVDEAQFKELVPQSPAS